MVIAVLFLNGNGLRAVVMAMTMQRRAVVMVGMIVTAVCVHVHRRHRSRKPGDGQREHERKEAAHEDESTTSQPWSARRAADRCFPTRVQYAPCDEPPNRGQRLRQPRSAS